MRLLHSGGVNLVPSVDSSNFGPRNVKKMDRGPPASLFLFLTVYRRAWSRLGRRGPKTDAGSSTRTEAEGTLTSETGLDTLERPPPPWGLGGATSHHRPPDSANPQDPQYEKKPSKRFNAAS